jgi:ABC-type cobalamin/Fe3+-siderophores transport system ATPase subunit
MDVLDHASLQVHPGEVSAILGSRRSGKSTLLRIAAGLAAPNQGVVSFEGAILARDGALTRPRRLRSLRPHREIAIVSGLEFQRVRGRETLAGYVNRGLRKARDRRNAQSQALLALKTLDLDALARHRWDWLSDRDRMMAMLAGALIGEPKLILVDDFSLYLGMLERARAMSALREVADTLDTAVLLTTEDLSGLQGVDAIGSLARGELIWSTSSKGAEVVNFPFRRRSA